MRELISVGLRVAVGGMSAGLRATAGLWKVLTVVVLLVSLAGVVAAVFANEDALIILFCLLALLLYCGLRLLEKENP